MDTALRRNKLLPLVNVSDIRAADTFPAAVVEEYNLVAIDAIYLIAVTIHGIPILALFNHETAVPEDTRRLIGITINLAAGTMIDVPITGAALERDVSPRKIVYFTTTVDAADEVTVFVGEIPCVAALHAVIAVIE